MENMELKGQNILVTGGNGFVGGWLVKELIEKGANVSVFIRDWPAEGGLVLHKLTDRVNIIKGRLEDYRAVERAFNESESQHCIHLAAQAIVGVANKSPLSTFESNIKGTWNILEASRILNVKKLVVASSDKAYGDQESLPYTEDLPLKGMHPYDVSKSCADLLCQCYHKTYGLPVGIVRAGNIYGGGDINYNRIIPGTIKSLIANESPIIRSDGTLIRDYLYTEDVVKSYISVLNGLSKKELHGQAFNFGNNHPVSVIDLVNMMIEISGKKIKPTILNEASNEITKQYLDSSKAYKELNWKPEVSLKEGLKKTFDWYVAYLAE